MLRSVLAIATVAAVALSIGLARSSRMFAAPPHACGDSASITWEPATPVRGALFRVLANGTTTGSQLTGAVAGEALHFTEDSGLASFAAAPIDGADSLYVVVRCRAESAVDSVTTWITTTSGDYPVERLQVAPAFGRPPDPVTAARIARESRRALEVATSAHVTPRLWNEAFIVPREARITSGFGGGREFNGNITSRHMGTDYAGATGAPVRAANRGVVRIVDAFFYGGNVVYVDHGIGLSSAYLHLSEHLVAAGDTVERGQTIGRVGATGRVTGPHLHFIVRYGAVTVDPLSLFAVAGDSSGSR